MARSPLDPAPDLSGVFSHTGARVAVRRAFCAWETVDAQGSITWGKPTEDDVVEMCDAYGEALRRVPSRPVIFDIRAIDSVNVLAFERFVRILGERGSEWRASAGRQVVVHSGGFSNALLLGALQLGARGFQLAAFEDLREALAWAGVPHRESELTALRASLLDVPDVVRRVRVALDEAERPLPLGALARKVGVSARSLQRHLAAAGTSMRAERARHLVVRAERLLEGTDLDLTAIAAMLGLSSAARLVALFRDARRTTPGEWRRARAAGDKE